MVDMTDDTYSVRFQSQGALLIYGPVDSLSEALSCLPPGLKVLAVCAGDKNELPRMSGVDMVSGVVMEVRGHLGAFRAKAAAPDGGLDLGPLSPNRNGLFDLVLDLYRTPLVSAEVLPLGYAHAFGNKDKIARKVDKLAKLVGNFSKPRYFHFNDLICGHDQLGLAGCRRCLDVCPAGAIASGRDGVEVDPYLCRGCGTCTLECPSGALSFVKPNPQTLLHVIGEGIRGRSSIGTAAPVLLIHSGLQQELPGSVVAQAVPSVTVVGMDIWFSALAMGASEVLIHSVDPLPSASRKVLDEQLDLARHWLRSLGQAPERIRVIKDLNGVDWQGLPNKWDPAPIGDFSAAGDKRKWLGAALRHIAGDSYEDYPQAAIPFGRLTFNESACSLCHACIGVCATAALSLQDGGLAVESWRCIQCGLCTEVCPEKALAPQPGIFPADFVRPQRRVLKSPGEQAVCVECGKAFGDRALIEASAAHVRDHPMYQGEGARLLQMCMDCRQKRVAQQSVSEA